MKLEWIDVYIDGLIDHCNSKDLYEIYDIFNIQIRKVSGDSFILQGNESIYIRDYLGIEVVFIRDDLHPSFERFILSHELGHALLHTELSKAAFNKKLIIKGRLEKQADYFALKLLDIHLDSVEYHGLTKSQIASELCVREDCLEYMCI